MTGAARRLGAPALVAGLAGLSVLPALGAARRLSYHEAIVAQGAREMLGPAGDWRVPTLGGLPWLEKPPLAHWLVAALGWLRGGVDEWVARLPSAVAAVGLCLVVWALARPRWGRRVALLAGLVQATTLWTVSRGRLADADMLLAALVSGVVLAFDQLRRAGGVGAWRWAFFSLLGATALAKGIGFGAVLAGATVGATLLWDRDWEMIRRLVWAPGWLLAALVAGAWPLVVVSGHPEAAPVWLAHVADRLGESSGVAGKFASEPTWRFLLAPLVMTLPWTPLGVIGLVRSARRATRPAGRGGGDRLLLAWGFVPVALLAMAPVKNDHYLIHALAPWSIWGALGLARLGARLKARRGWSAARLGRAARVAFPVIGLAYAVGFAVLGPLADDRGREWAWYEGLRPHLVGGESLVLLYDWDGPDPWDRLPYPTPFGVVPPDLAVRLFYLGEGLGGLPLVANASGNPGEAVSDGRPLMVICRPRDVEALGGVGTAEVVSKGPGHRWDREYVLVRLGEREGIGMGGRRPASRRRRRPGRGGSRPGFGRERSPDIAWHANGRA